MKADGLDNVRREPVYVPTWVRGNESAVLLAPRIKKLGMLGLGGSIATPPVTKKKKMVFSKIEKIKMFRKELKHLF